MLGASRRASRSYRAAVPAFIADRELRLPSAVAALAEEASAEIARFDAELRGEAALYGDVLLQLESAASSQIEGFLADAQTIALARLGVTASCDAQEIVGNLAAMRLALESADDAHAGAILAIHAALLGDLHPDTAGCRRKEQVWIGGTPSGPHEATFVPPHQEHLPALIADLVAFTQRTDLPLLAHAAIAHAQFETIHPFPDGNGRTGRALIHSMLRGHRLTQNVTAPLSAGLIANTNTYFDALTAYRGGDPSKIVQSLAEASLEATANGRRLVAALRGIYLTWDEKIRARRGASAWRVAGLVLRQPVIDAATVGAELGIAPQNAQRAIAPLAEAGVLTEFTGLRRNRMWQAREVLAALDGFDSRVRQRR